ncbi:2-keto-4-pentenoate hydratase [Bacillus sp. 1NLA3E]|uniref:2-keto-4-pentenoate hydratase n=1 Tax=Bacillus sp. 1NLA3E TaxID=666686 RepID=UPI000247F15B|nr:fumarylacetoacetate hydrolase family protein [Bacillus sp. 1NLA3E]AGK54542.1 2-hydroxypenta-2,4-dienoate hydratase [Bacillus sp. 1NLA3E]
MVTKIRSFAEMLVKAETSRIGMDPLTLLEPNLSIGEAYSIQLENINKKVSKGQRITGKKIGLTSKAMQDLLGVNEPDYGHLLNTMIIENGGEISCTGLLQPKVEAEIAFKLKKELTGPNVTVADVILATDYIVPSLEIVDSRIKDWQIKLVDTIADNASSGLYVLGGTPTKVDDVDLELMGMAFYKNGVIANTGAGAAALGNPAICVAWLANKLAEYNISLKAGEIILSGALSAAVEAKPGDVFTAKFACLGEVSVHFVD